MDAQSGVPLRDPGRTAPGCAVHYPAALKKTLSIRGVFKQSNFSHASARRFDGRAVIFLKLLHPIRNILRMIFPRCLSNTGKNHVGA